MNKTQFNPGNKKTLTYGEALGPAMKIMDPEDAAQYLRDYIKWQENNMQEVTVDYTAEQICKRNLGYFAGYYDSETRDRVERLFNCSHPIFGSIKSNGTPSVQEAFSKGSRAAKKS